MGTSMRDGSGSPVARRGPPAAIDSGPRVNASRSKRCTPQAGRMASALRQRPLPTGTASKHLLSAGSSSARTNAAFKQPLLHIESMCGMAARVPQGECPAKWASPCSEFQRSPMSRRVRRPMAARPILIRTAIPEPLVSRPVGPLACEGCDYCILWIWTLPPSNVPGSPLS